VAASQASRHGLPGLNVTSPSTIAALWLAGLRSGLQYRTDTIVVIVMALVFQGTGFAFVWVVLSRFGSLGGWTLGEIAFLYGLRLTIHALAGAIAGPVFNLEWTVRTGDFDRYLVRPVAPLVGFLTQRVEVSILGDLIGGLAIFAAANTAVAIAWSPIAIGYLGLAVVGGALVEVAWRVLVGALTFRLLTSQWLEFLVDSVFSTYGNYPLGIFGSALSWAFTFLVPIAFIGYLPASVLLGRTPELIVDPVIAYAAPLVGLAWVLVSARVFAHELRHYQSSGH
jgi:ABC-2 type transport system permease protein